MADVGSPGCSRPDFDERSADLAEYVYMSFDQPDKKFTGDPDQFWADYEAEYRSVSRACDLSDKQRLLFLHNLLGGDAKRFYSSDVQDKASTYTEAVAMIEAHYNTDAKQKHAKFVLDHHRMSSLVAAGLTEMDALAATYSLINKLAPRVPRHYHGDAFKVDFLKNAVLGYPWAMVPLRRALTDHLSYRQLYRELEVALHIRIEGERARAKTV